MEQKTVKIIGLSLNNQLGILKAQQLTFDPNNKLILFKGIVGSGKTTTQKALQIATQGSKTLTDKQLYGDIDEEVQLLDGEHNLFIGVKSKGKTLDYTIYQKDANGKKVKNSIIDGVKATPSSYLNALQTKLTWRLDELTSENPKVQRDILLELYQKDLIKQGVIFDKKHPQYRESILGRIDTASEQRDYLDRTRKLKGGIKEDLKAEGFNVERPETLPNRIDVVGIDSEIRQLDNDKVVFKTTKQQEYKNKLDNVEVMAETLRKDIRWNNSELTQNYNNLVDARQKIINKNKLINDYAQEMHAIKDKIAELGYLESFHLEVGGDVVPDVPILSDLIQIDPASNKIDRTTLPEGSEFEKRFNELVNLHQSTGVMPDVNLDAYDEKIEALATKKMQAEAINKVCDAVDSYKEWAQANEEVVRLKGEYVKLLKNVNTGVEGLHIVPVESDIYLMYDGSYDPAYFGNTSMELRKLASYSDTQKPVICLLVQNYLLSKLQKAMRYLYIDKVPIDNATRLLLEDMAAKLNLTLIVNWTGDFEKEALVSGEFLIEGGEVFFS